MQERIASSDDYLVNQVSEPKEVTIAGKKVKDVIVVTVENASGESVMFVRPKQREGQPFNWATMSGKIVNLPTREQVAGVTGYKDESGKEILDTESGIYPQPFINGITNEIKSQMLIRTLQKNLDEKSDINRFKGLSKEDKAVWAQMRGLNIEF